jgi:SHS2 domain-containing protein
MIRGRVDYELVEHTADTGILVRGDSMADLFERAAAALFDVMVDIDRVRPGDEAETVTADGIDRETLLVSWLGELLSRAMAKEFVYGAFEVVSIDDARVVGRVWGEPLDVARHDFRTEVKAVTYHHLLVSEDRDGWSARVILDL